MKSVNFTIKGWIKATLFVQLCVGVFSTIAYGEGNRIPDVENIHCLSPRVEISNDSLGNKFKEVLFNDALKKTFDSFEGLTHFFRTTVSPFRGIAAGEIGQMLTFKENAIQAYNAALKALLKNAGIKKIEIGKDGIPLLKEGAIIFDRTKVQPGEDPTRVYRYTREKNRADGRFPKDQYIALYPEQGFWYYSAMSKADFAKSAGSLRFVELVPAKLTELSVINRSL